MTRWSFLKQSPAAPTTGSLPAPKPATSKHLDAPELLDLVKWHIDRYDRLRSSTSARASILLSASSILLTAMILLLNYRLQLREAYPLSYLDLGIAAAAVATTVLAVTSINSCINAIATRKTTRSLHMREIPSRFLFNWGDTVNSVDGYTSFAEQITNLDYDAILGHGVAELWTDILQHRRRHGHLRRGIGIFRYSVVTLLALAALTLVVAL